MCKSNITCVVDQSSFHPESSDIDLNTTYGLDVVVT